MAGDQHSVNLRNTTGPYMLVPSLHVVGAIQEEFGPTRGITQLDNGLVVRHIEVVRSFLQGFLNLATKYAKIVSDDVVTPILEAHIVQTLFLQKQAMAQEWECLCFLQKEIIQLQKWMVSAFPSPAAHIRGETLETYFELLHFHHKTGQVHLLPSLSGLNILSK